METCRFCNHPATTSIVQKAAMGIHANGRGFFSWPAGRIPICDACKASFEAAVVQRRDDPRRQK